MSRTDLEVALAAARRGAAVLDEHYRFAGVRAEAESKTERRNLVTSADRAAEDAVLSVLRAERPDDTIVAEESAPDARAGERAWFVDPLDGTNNFAHGLPLFCVSVALRRAGRPAVGVIVAPRLDEEYAVDLDLPGSARGPAGPLEVSGTDELADAVAATGFAYRRGELPDDNVDRMRRVLHAGRGMRRCGSAALDLAWVAAGRYDAFWELWLSPWDVAAGATLVLGAGGRVTDLAGGDDWLTGTSIVATNGHLHAELSSVLGGPPLPPS